MEDLIPHSCSSNGCQNNGLLQCSQCKKQYYCSTLCQKKDWKVHKLECSSSSSSLPDPQHFDIIMKNLPGRDEINKQVFWKYAVNHVIIEDLLNHCLIMFKNINSQGTGVLFIKEELQLNDINKLMENSNYNITFPEWRKHIQLHYDKKHIIIIIMYDWLTTNHFVKTICTISNSVDKKLIIL